MPLTVSFEVEPLDQTAHFARVFMISSTHSISAGGVFICDASAGAFTITLPAAGALRSATGRDDARILIIKKKDSSVNAVTVSRSGSDTIDGATSYSLSSQYDTIVLCDDLDDNAWNIIGTV